LAYIEIDIIIEKNRTRGADITIAELAAAGYESFLDTEHGIKAYIREGLYNSTLLEKLTVIRSDEFGDSYYKSLVIKDINWNKKWESEYHPVSVADFCLIRSPFHPPGSSHKYEIVIEPKMSFGTGHHETTWLMVSKMKDITFSDKTVLDVGCGTGILSILASMQGARDITAIDTDEWAYENSKENIQRNKVGNCRIIHGSIDAAAGRKYNIILANITRNVNLKFMSEYKKLCTPGGNILLSGFYKDDMVLIKKEAALNGFLYIDYLTKKNWVSVLFLRQ
jgi:ribosomal protein L11 methyltransferase